MNVSIKRERYIPSKGLTVYFEPRRPDGRLKKDIQRPPAYRGAMRRSILSDHRAIRKDQMRTIRKDLATAIIHIKRDIALPTDLVARLLGYGVNAAALKEGTHA